MEDSLEGLAYRTIKEKIVSASLEPGVLFSENELSAQLGISRTPMHTAIVRLCREGFLDAYSRKGFVVREISVKEFFDMHEAIVSMEHYALTKAKLGGIELAMDRLKAALDGQAAALADGDNLGYYQRGFDFAAIILEGADNGAMTQVLEGFREKMLYKVVSYRKRHPERRPRITKDKNEKIYAALARGDLEAAQGYILGSLADSWDFLHREGA